ncbi:Hypothetical protein R9X50_00371300 [Acrodontium crateriforme]|uniref:C2H2-type domain-containing protein n=1 Tax=Acrodontium crateriforme TaxID=150365 RepID=A0AAQ3M6P3_9PEZI|nr:Hypothetical protein R9X50_00371300 [Acrodontium crateriforme]
MAMAVEHDGAVMSANGRMSYRCEACNKSYTERRALARHRHSDLHRRTTNQPLTQKYPCSTCGKTFQRNHDRQRHENEMHKGLKRSGITKREHEKSDADDAPRRKVKRTHSARGSVSLSQPPRPPPVSNWQYWNEESAAVVTPWCIEPTESRSKSSHSSKTGTSWSHASSVSPRATPSLRAPSESNSLNLPPANLRGQTWFADESSSDDESLDVLMKDTPLSQLSLRTMSSAGDSAIDMSQDREAKFPSITTLDFRDFDPASAKAAMSSQVSLIESTRALQIPPRHATSSTLLMRGKVRRIGLRSRDTTRCIFCKDVFEDEPEKLLPHLQKHLDMLKRDTFKCALCDLPFANEADLRSHTTSAKSKGNCGIDFEHTTPCTGHHPFVPGDDAHTNPDNVDANRMRATLTNWEQAQLQSYIAEINELIEAREKRVSSVFSIEALMRRSRNSVASFAFSVATHTSAPCDIDVDGKLDVQGISRHFKGLKIRGEDGADGKSSSDRLHHTTKKLRKGILDPSTEESLQKQLSDAAIAGNYIKIIRLNALGASPNIFYYQHSILAGAAEHADVATMQLLVSKGASIHMMDNQYGTPLSAAAFAGKVANAKWLLDEGSDIHRAGGQFGCPLSSAVAGNNLDMVALLIAHGADVHQLGGEFGSPFSTAVAKSSQAVVELLLKHGASVNAEGGREGSPLGVAVWHGRIELIRYLISKGAKINVLGGLHGTPLCSAIARMGAGSGFHHIVGFLVENGADVNLEGILGTPLRVAAERAGVPHMPKIVRMLLKYGASVHASNPQTSALMKAKASRVFWLQKVEAVEYDHSNNERSVKSSSEIITILRQAGAVDFDHRMEMTGTIDWNQPISRPSVGRVF